MATSKKPWYLEYWPILLFGAGLLGSSFTFYAKNAAVAADVVLLQKAQPTYVKETISDLKFRLVENRIESLDDKVDENEQRQVEQLEKIDKKLEKIQDLLLESAKRSTASSN